MEFSNINDAYKIQNFNSEQGKRFYKYKMAEPPTETYNIMEGFNDGFTDREKLNNAQSTYINNNRNAPDSSYNNRNIFVVRNAYPPEDIMCKPKGVAPTSYNYTSKAEAIVACRYTALNKSPQHDLYQIDASSNGAVTNPTYMYGCSTSSNMYTTTQLQNEITANYTKDTDTKTNTTLYSFIKPAPVAIPQQIRFIRSPGMGNYAHHKKVCAESGGRYKMASVTSDNDIIGIMDAAYGTSRTENLQTSYILGGYRDTNIFNRSKWKWEDNSEWNYNIAKRNLGGRVRSGWSWWEPNDYNYNGTPTSGEPVLLLLPSGRWNDIYAGWSSYAIYKEVYNSVDNTVDYSAFLRPDGTMAFDVKVVNTTGSTAIVTNNIILAMNASDNITLPPHIRGCSEVTGGDLNKPSIKLQYQYKCTT